MAHSVTHSRQVTAITTKRWFLYYTTCQAIQMSITCWYFHTYTVSTQRLCLCDGTMGLHDFTRLLGQARLMYTPTHTHIHTGRRRYMWNFQAPRCLKHECFYEQHREPLVRCVCVYWCGVCAHVQKFNFKEPSIICQFNSCACVCVYTWESAHRF